MSRETLAKNTQINAALQLIETLRDSEKGCPWLSSRSFEDLFPYFLEELYEYKEAYQTQGPQSPEARQELADLVFQVLLHTALMKEQAPESDLEMIASDVVKKLMRRHPHVFDKNHTPYKTAEEAGKAWEELKAKEAKEANRHTELTESMADKIDRIPKAIPSLQRAARIGEKTHSFEFDWENPGEVLQKVKEEMSELEEELKRSPINPKDIAEELGDVFFSLAQLARHLGHCPEELSYQANEKFIRRFRATESLAKERQLPWKELNSTQREALWLEAKIKLKSSK